MTQRAGKPDSGFDPNCSACGQPYSEHYEEDEGLFCNLDTNGDVFSDYPGDSQLIELLMVEDIELYRRLVAKWRDANGYSPGYIGEGDDFREI